MFHKSCVTVYNKQKLNRKRKHAGSFNVHDAPETLLSLIQLKFESIVATLIYELHRYETFAVTQKVRKIAHELGDTKIMAKLSEGI